MIDLTIDNVLMIRLITREVLIYERFQIFKQGKILKFSISNFIKRIKKRVFYSIYIKYGFCFFANLVIVLVFFLNIIHMIII